MHPFYPTILTALHCIFNLNSYSQFLNSLFIRRCFNHRRYFFRVRNKHHMA